MVDERVEIPGVVAKGQLLTLTSGEAREVGYAKGEVADEAALLDAIGLGGAQVVIVEPNWAEQVVRFLTNPLVVAAAALARHSGAGASRSRPARSVSAG